MRALLGKGAMGEVYLAQDTTMPRLVALKLLPADVTNKKDRLNRFKREADAASSLNHPNILTIYEHGVEKGHHFIATEFIDGESLREHINRTHTELLEVLDIGIQVASAMAAAHAAGIVHRDIKPENIMLRKDRIVKVLDFGLAKLIEQEDPSAIDTKAQTKALVNTEVGAAVGTISYMSPEQARGLAEVDERTDIWSLGVVLYEMLAGRLPFIGQSKSDVIAAILKTEPPVLTRYASDVPAELERIVTKTLRKDCEERYQGAKDLGLDLRSLKQRFEFEAELERTGTPEKNSEPGRPVTNDDAKNVGTNPVAVTQTDVPTDFHRASSAEYIFKTIRQHWHVTLIVLATLVAVGIAVAYLLHIAGSGTAEIHSIAVLPLKNMTNDPNAEYLSDGISVSLINSLSQLPQLKVVAQSSSFKYKGREFDVQEVATALGVQAIVTGRIEQRGDILQISVELVNASDKTQMWGKQYNRKATDIQGVQEEIASAISAKLRVKLTGAQEQQLTKRATENPEAYRLYLNGEFYSRKGQTEGKRKALDYYNQAIALDPNFALAYVGVAEEYDYFAGSSLFDTRDALAKEKVAVQKALELDDTLAQAHVRLGSIKLAEWDWAGAEFEYKRALELNPNLTRAHGEYSSYLTVMGRHTEALVEIERAQEHDPLNMFARNGEGAALYNAHRFDEAIRQLQHVIEMQPDFSFAHYFLGVSYAMKGMYTEAIAEYQKFSSLEGETTSEQIYLGYTYAMSGQREKALATLNRLKTTNEYVSPAELAILYTGLGDKEGAFQALERAYTAHDLQMQYLKVEPHYDSLRSDPRFADLMRRVGLPL